MPPAHNVLCHSNAHTEPRPMPTANTYVNVKRVFNTQSEVMGFVIYVGEVINVRMMKYKSPSASKNLLACTFSTVEGFSGK